MEINKFILLSLPLVLVLGLVESFDFDEKELESEESLHTMYERWQAHHNVEAAKNDEIKSMRFDAFKFNAHHVHNSNKMNKPYTLQLNKFADMPNHEFKSMYADSKIQHHIKLRGTPTPINKTFSFIDHHSLPESVDWRKENAVVPVKNQLHCGSCWSFSTAVIVEGIYAIRTKKLISVSEQELIDCDDSNNGCDGGIMDTALDYIVKNGGITTEANYPYQGGNGTCNRIKETDHVVTIDGADHVPPNDEDLMLQALANQPLAIAVDSAGCDFQFYKEGVFTGSCGFELQHAVALVGYGTSEDGLKYWILKNSWGPEWGEGGYMKIHRGIPDKRGLCGLAQHVVFAVKNDDPKPLKEDL